MESKVRESKLKSGIKKIMPFRLQKFIYNNFVKKARMAKIALDKKITKEDIVNRLKEIGIKKDDSLMVHSSLSRIGMIEGGAETLIDAFLEVIGKNGLLAMPAFSALDFDKEKNLYVFDVNKTPAYTGSVPESLRKRKGTKRSISPTHSVIAFGKKADWVVKDHEKCDNPYGREGPFYKLLELNAKICLVGVDQLANSSIHIVEDSYAQFPFKVWDEKKKVEVTFEDGKKKIIEARWHLPHLYKIRDNNMLEKPFLQENLMSVNDFFNTEIRIITEKDMLDCMTRLAKKNMTIYNPKYEAE